MIVRSSMESATSELSPYELLLQAALFIPVSHYLLGLFFVLLVFLYHFFEIHFLRDLFTGFRGQSVSLTFNSSSNVYQVVVSKCKLLHSRYFAFAIRDFISFVKVNYFLLQNKSVVFGEFAGICPHHGFAVLICRLLFLLSLEGRRLSAIEGDIFCLILTCYFL